jgi:hypothetical protein
MVVMGDFTGEVGLTMTRKNSSQRYSTKRAGSAQEEGLEKGVLDI